MKKEIAVKEYWVTLLTSGDWKQPAAERVAEVINDGATNGWRLVQVATGGMAAGNIDEHYSKSWVYLVFEREQGEEEEELDEEKAVLDEEEEEHE